MIPPNSGRPPYRLVVCPRTQADRAADLPFDVRDRFTARELSELGSVAQRRRRDRVAGRLAAKRALAAHFLEEFGWNAEPRDLEIGNDPAGRPVLRLPRGAPAPSPSFSIAHCAEGAAAAVASQGRLVGVDMEMIVPRPAEVMAFVSAEGDDPLLPSVPEAQARLWTGKEAALKLFGLGLDADARGVRDFGGEVSFSGLPEKAWRGAGAPRVRVVYEAVGPAMVAVAFTGD
jgi:phosphopantetheinyl transferase